MIYLLAWPTAKSGDASESKPAVLAVYEERINFQLQGAEFRSPSGWEQVLGITLYIFFNPNIF